jgi:hypothetical protein
VDYASTAFSEHIVGCFAESVLHQYIKAGAVWLQVVGPSDTSWYDCVSYIEYRDSWATALACGENISAIGMKNGRITAYDQSPCQEHQVVNHEKPVKLLTFDQSTDRFGISRPEDTPSLDNEGRATTDHQDLSRSLLQNICSRLFSFSINVHFKATV